MRPLIAFENYLKEGIVKKVSVDIERADNLVGEAERKLCSMDESLEKIGIKISNANDYVECCYDILLFLIRAKLYLQGYSTSGQGAHEAEVAYLQELGFNESEVRFVDQMRYFRNGILYYGTRLDKEYAEKVIEFTLKIYPKLKKKHNP